MGAVESLPAVQSVEVGDAVSGESKARRLTSAPLPTQSKAGSTVDNLYSNFARSAELFPSANAMGKRVKLADGKLGPFEYMSFATCHDEILKIGSGIASLGLSPKDSMGMYAVNSIEWQLCCLGGFSQGLVCVPVYDTLGDNIVEYEAKHADMKIMFVDKAKLGSVGKVVANCPTLKHVVQLEPLDGADEATLAPFKAAGVNVTDLPSLIVAGVKSPSKPRPLGASDLAYIMYTSGTTGDPKGVCITQGSIVIGASYCAGIEILPTDRYLSFLPLAHIFETVVEHGLWSGGASVGFFNGNIKLLLDDILACRPTIFCGVPRVYQRFYEQAYSKINAMAGPIKALLLHALESEIAAVKSGTKTLWGKVLAKLLGAKLHGGAVRVMVSGAAPLPSHVQDFLLAACGCAVVQGYGMTENAANATLAMMADTRAGHVGPPMLTAEVKLVDVPEMNYLSSDSPPRGEVCTRGPTVFAGYHKNPEETDKVLEADGWLHTGDIGRFNADGTLSIIDRKKNIFKLAQGEYVAAEKIEMAISKSKYISQPWVYGNSFFPQLVAVVTPDYVELKAAALAGGWAADDTTELAKKPEAIALIMKEIENEAKTAKLKSFEVPKAVVLEGSINELAQGFSIANDCLTPTFKLKRPQLLARYREAVDAMYVSLGEDPSKYK